jgi:hypothetical protein
VLVNALLLWLLAFLFPARFAAENLLWLLVGGLVLGLLSSFLESLLGLTMPIVPDEPAELRHQLEEQARQVDWLAAATDEAEPEEQALITEAPSPDANAAEPSTPGPDEGPSPPAEVEAEPFDSVAMPAAEAAISVDPEPAPEPREEQKEDRS